MSAYLILLLGLTLIFIEFFLPGMIIGTFGAVLVVASIFMFASETTSGVAVMAYVAAVALILIYLAKFAIWRIQKTKSHQSIYSDASQEGYIASSFDASTIGKKGVVLTDLKPGGYILLEDKKLQAISVSGYLSQGTQVEVIGGQEESLIVKQI